MAVYSQDIYQETTKVKCTAVLTVPLNILAYSTTGFLCSKYKYVSNKTIWYERKKERNTQTRLLCTYFHCDKSSGFSDVTIVKQFPHCCRYMYLSRLQANKIIRSEVNVQKTRAR
jgi:hypothetical protein